MFFFSLFFSRSFRFALFFFPSVPNQLHGHCSRIKRDGGGGRDEAKSASNFARQCPLTRRRIPIVDEGKNSAHSL